MCHGRKEGQTLVALQDQHFNFSQSRDIPMELEELLPCMPLRWSLSTDHILPGETDWCTDQGFADDGAVNRSTPLKFR